MFNFLRYKRIFSCVVALLFIGSFTIVKDAAGDEKNREGISQKVVVINIQALRFHPDKVVVKAGTKIRWVNLDPIAHDVTSGTAIAGRKARNLKKTKFPDGKFQSGTFGKDESYEIVLKEKGEYRYFCNVHPHMQAIIIVE